MSFNDRNLLFGVLALQRGYARADQLVAALHAWALLPGRPLAAFLIEQGALTPAQSAEVETLARDRARDTPPEDTSPGPAPGPPACRYRKVRLHATGGMGDVYAASDAELNRVVALKEIQDRYADRRDLQARFRLEAEVTGRLEHPGIVPVYGLGTYPDGRPYYAMRLIKGETLQAALRRYHEANARGADPAGQALAFRGLLGRFIDVCDAVAYAHSRGVIHRDLKPANVLLGPFGETLVVDWGLARVTGEGSTTPNAHNSTLRPAALDEVLPTQYGARSGTEAYMAPEQRAGRLDEIGPRTDVYLLGGILYEILTGVAPHPAGTPASPRDPRALRPAAPVGLAAVATRALAQAPADRPRGVRELASEVELWLAEEPLEGYRADLRRLEEQSARRPGAADVLEALARTRVSLGLVLCGMSRPRDGEQVFRQAIADYESALRSAPGQARFRADLGAVRLHLERALRALGRDREADEARDAARLDLDRVQSGGAGDVRLADVLLTMMPGPARSPRRPARTMTAVPTVGSAAARLTARTGRHAVDPRSGDHPLPTSDEIPTSDELPITGSRFTLVRRVGAGVTSAVWAARDELLGREVAVKTLREGADRGRFLTEAWVLARLEHPNICPLYAVGGLGEGETPFLVLRLAQGGDLHTAAAELNTPATPPGERRGRLRRLVAALAGACRGVAHAHRQGVVHRDPKPANVLLGDAGQAHVADWGLARLVIAPPDVPPWLGGDDTDPGAVVGTPGYLAPEAARGEPGDARADVYVLGAGLYELLTGQPPHAGASAVETLDRVASGPPPRPAALIAGVPAYLENVCLRAMARNPAERYPGAAALANALDRWLARADGPAARLWYGFWDRVTPA